MCRNKPKKISVNNFIKKLYLNTKWYLGVSGSLWLLCVIGSKFKTASVFLPYLSGREFSDLSGDLSIQNSMFGTRCKCVNNPVSQPTCQDPVKDILFCCTFVSLVFFVCFFHCAKSSCYPYSDFVPCFEQFFWILKCVLRAFFNSNLTGLIYHLPLSHVSFFSRRKITSSKVHLSILWVVPCSNRLAAPVAHLVLYKFPPQNYWCISSFFLMLLQESCKNWTLDLGHMQIPFFLIKPVEFNYNRNAGRSYETLKGAVVTSCAQTLSCHGQPV